MAIRIWRGGTSTDMTTVANYSGAGALANDDTIVCTGTPTNSPTTGLTALNALTGITFIVDDTWTGQGGTESNAIQIGTGATLHFDNTRGGVHNFDIETATLVSVKNTPATAKIYFSAGTLALVLLRNGSGSIFSGATATMMRIIGAAQSTIQPASTLTAISIQHSAAYAIVQCALVTADVLSGTLDHIGGAVGGTTVNAWGGLTRLRCTGAGTYTKLNVLGGTVDMAESGENRTVTNADVVAGLFNAPAQANITHTNAVNWYGGTCIATSMTPQSPAAD